MIATHFHELGPMLGIDVGHRLTAPHYPPHHDGLAFFCSKLIEDDTVRPQSFVPATCWRVWLIINSGLVCCPQTGFRISYRFESGFNAESKGLKAAQLAGLPQEGLDQAKATFDLIRSRREMAQMLAGDQRMLEPPFVRLEEANRRRRRQSEGKE
jgi:hypothetical protein